MAMQIQYDNFYQAKHLDYSNCDIILPVGLGEEKSTNYYSHQEYNTIQKTFIWLTVFKVASQDNYCLLFLIKQH